MRTAIYKSICFFIYAKAMLFSKHCLCINELICQDNIFHTKLIAILEKKRTIFHLSLNVTNSQYRLSTLCICVHHREGSDIVFIVETLP